MDHKQSSLDNNNSQQEQQYQEQYNETFRQRSAPANQAGHDVQSSISQDMSSYYQHDVRMKRHPELQPYVPSDRFNRITLKTSSSSMTTSSQGLPKKYCSMSRLNQLAQPKNKKTTTTNTNTRDFNTEQLPQRQQSQQQRQQVKPAAKLTVKTQQQQQQPKPLPRPQLTKPPQQQQQLRSGQKQQQKQRQQQGRQSVEFKEQQKQQQLEQRRLSDRSQPITPITNTSAKPTTMITPLSPTTVMPTQTPHSSTPVVRTPRNTPSTPAVHQLPTPASSLEEELESAANRTRDIVSIVSEMSINDPFYQSAASELVPDSEKSNGNDFDRNAESLCRDFEQDLIAKGILKETSAVEDEDLEFRSPMSNGKKDSIRSTSTVITSENLTKLVDGSQGAYDEDDRRLKIEKELRDKAKKEDDDRKERDKLVESILSRVSQGSVS